MSEVKHTPTPWRQHYPLKPGVIVDAHDKRVAEVFGRDIWAPNAAFIVRACNAHDALVRELSHLVRLIEPMERDGSLNIPGLATLNGAREALAEADGKP